MLAVGALDRSCGKIRNVTTSLGLCDRDTSTLLAGKEIGEESLLQVLAAELDNWWNSKCKAGIQRTTWTAQT